MTICPSCKHNHRDQVAPGQPTEPCIKVVRNVNGKWVYCNCRETVTIDAELPGQESLL
jgi:hypothetical protein